MRPLESSSPYVPDRIVVRRAVAADAADIGAISIHQIDFVIVVVVRDKNNLTTIRRPGRSVLFGMLLSIHEPRWRHPNSANSTNT
jgi:hypothetical protein